MRTLKLLALLVLVLPSALVRAQETKPPAPPISKVGCLPLTFSEDRPSAIEKVKATMKTLVQGVGMEWVDEGRVLGAWTRMGERPEPKDIPDDKKLLDLGQRLGVDYLVAGTCNWKIRSVWVALGPKTKAICTIELVIIDVRGERVAHRAKETADSTKREEGWATAASILINPLTTLVSGGPKTPHMERSGVVAVAKAMEEWLRPFRRGNDEIGKKIK